MKTTKKIQRKIDKYTKAKGFVLIEVIIVLGMLILIVPTIFYSYFTTEKLMLGNINRVQKQNEFDYLTSFIRQDLKTAVTFSQSVNGFSYSNQDADQVDYYLQDHKFKRKTTSLNKKSQTFIITNALKINSLAVSKTPFLLELTFNSDLGTNKIRVSLPNEQE